MIYALAGLLVLVVLLQLRLLMVSEKLARANSGSEATEIRALCASIEKSQRQLNDRLTQELAANRAEGAGQAKATREELQLGIGTLSQGLLANQSAAGTAQAGQLREFAERLETLRTSMDLRMVDLAKTSEESERARREQDARSAQTTRAELQAALETLANSVARNVNAMGEQQRVSHEAITGRVEKIAESTEKRLDALRAVVDERLRTLQEDNAKKLDEMRGTVDEKLQGTLNQRLTESFALVSERLESVQKGLGEMQSLANGVGDLKKVLSNVKTRGTWGEIQLGNLLEQVLTAQQYAHNVMVAPGKSEVVEYAIRLPGREESLDELWLPIDAKFPHEDYERLTMALEAADPEAVEIAGKQLENQIKKCAKDINQKYIAPPHTTDFAILFLPTEGLYAEVIRRAGLVESLQREHRVTLAGPTTLTAILNSLQMGFRTLAIQKQSSEVWKVLGETKTEFEKYALVLERVKKKLGEAQNTVDDASKRTRAITRKLRTVEALPVAANGAIVAAAPEALLPLEEEMEELPDGG